LNKKRALTMVVGLILAGTHAGWTEVGDAVMGRDGFLANAKEVFRPLLADPRELQFALRLTMPVSHRPKGEIAAGDYFGLYRWTLPWTASYVQWSVGGGVVSRFDMDSIEKSNEVLDYSVYMPLDVRVGKWSSRLAPYHISSHLGDDFIKETGVVPEKYSFDAVKWLFAYEPLQNLRFYGGFHAALRNRTVDLGRYTLQAGGEWRSGWWAGGHAQTFLANDFQSWERVGWNPENTTQCGVRFAHDPLEKQAIALFTEYGTGVMAYGQLFQRRESHWVLGIRFELP
jgi:hypothetical protein